MPKFNRKSILTLAVLLIAAASFGTFVYFRQTAYKKVLADNEALLIIDYGQGEERWFKGQVTEGMTVANILQTSSISGNFSFKLNSHLTALEGLANSQEKQWRCYLGTREIKEDLSQKIIQPKDKISCHYR